MKTITRIFIWGLLLFPMCAFAQTQKESIIFSADSGCPIDFVGDYTYQFIRQQDGTKLEQGPFDMKASINQEFEYKRFWKATVKGTYNLNGSHSKGNLNGPLTMSANLSISATNGDKATYSTSFRGNFKNGVPEGNFNVDHKYALPIKVNVNYKDGVLVGSYYVKGWDDCRLPFTTSGTLTSNGELTGTWTFEDAETKRYVTFANGVAIKQYDYDDDLCAKAKAYASGSISKESLLNDNICVLTGSLMLGKDAWTQILHKGIAWGKLGGYTFANAESIEYYYLKRLIMLSPEGYEKFKNGLVEYIKFGGERVQSTADYEPEDIRIKSAAYYNANNLRFDKECGLYCMGVNMNFEVFAKYCVGPIENTYCMVYFTMDQYNEIQQLMHETRMLNIDKVPITDINYPVSGLEYKIVDDFKQCPFDTNVIVYYDHYSNDRHRRDEVLYYSRDVFEDYFIALGCVETILKVSPQDRYDIINHKNHVLLEEIRLEQERIAEQKRLEQERIAEQKRLAEIEKQKKLIQPICDYLVLGKTALSICYGEQTSNYFDPTGLSSTWELDLEKAIKPFCKIVACKLVSYDPSTEVAVLEITKLGKKKVNIVYHVPVLIKNGKIVVTSIDITKATIIE